MRSERRVIAYLAFLSIILAFGIDASLPALDELREEFDLRAGSGEVSLIVTYYFLGMAAGQMIWGLLSDRFGRRPALLVGLGLYAVGALTTGLANSMSMLLSARFVWGLGAAAPSVLRAAITRDLYSGDQMARIISFTTAVFLVGPAVAPAIGEAILLSGSWRLVFISAVPLALVAAGWTVAFGETLDPAHRRPLSARATISGVRVVVRNRTTVGYMLTAMFTLGGFMTYLGSSQPIIDEIYDLGEWFALIFGAGALFIGTAVFVSGLLTPRFGAVRVARFAVVVLTLISAVFSIVSSTTGGVPPFWAWFLMVSLFGAFAIVLVPAVSALAMQPMSRIAGTAAGVFGLVTIGGGSLLASVVDSRISDSVTPMAIGDLVYSSVAIGFLWWAQGGSLDLVDP